MIKLYSPNRLWKVFKLLLSFYLLIKKRSHLFGIRPLDPDKLALYITQLGASFIKLAQVLATRSDFFDAPYLNALKTLHDDLPPMVKKDQEVVLKKAFELLAPFQEFNEIPIASASIGQVHEAWLQDGTKVAVKLRRLNIEKRVRADIKILTIFNRIFRPLFSTMTRHSIEAVIVEFSKMIVQECSFIQEKRNLEKFSLVYERSGIHFPKLFTQWCSDDALVMTFEAGYRFDDRQAIESLGLDITPIINRLVRFYTDQMLVEGYFHADPHPGNLLINEQGELILLDFGMVKHVHNSTRIAIIELIRAANERDFEAYVSAAKRLGTISYDAPQAELAEFTERMFDIFSNDTLDSSSMQKLAFDVLEQTRNLPFKLPQEAIYILRVSAIIEGLGTTYIENFNGIKDILPILQNNIPRALGVKDSFFETIMDEFKQFPEDILSFRETIRKAKRGELQIELSTLQLNHLESKLSDAIKNLKYFFILVVLGMLAHMSGYEEISYFLIGLASARILFK